MSTQESISQQRQALLHRMQADLKGGPWLAGGWIPNQKSRIYGLFIAIDDYIHLNPLNGCVNDARLIADTLSSYAESMSIEWENRFLLDKEATRESIADAFRGYLSQAKKDDLCIIFYCGHAQNNAEPDLPYLFLSNTEVSTPEKAISATALHGWLSELGEAQVTLILDTDGSGAFIQLAEQADTHYCTLLASQAGQHAYETVGLDGQTHGLFSYSLVQAWKEYQTNGLQMLDQVAEKVAAAPQEQNVVYLHQERFFLPMDKGASLPKLIRTLYGQDDPPVLSELHYLSDLFEEDIPLGLAEGERLACGLSRRQDYASACGILESLQQSYSEPEYLYLSQELGLTYLSAKRSSMAFSQVENYLSQEIQQEIDRHRHPLWPLRERLRIAGQQKKKALLVGVAFGKENKAQKAQVGPDLEAWHHLLTHHLGFAEEDVIRLEGNKATQSQVLKHFEQLAQHGQKDPALFVFAGWGMGLKENQVAIEAYDKPVLLTKLQELSKVASKLIVVFDTGFSPASQRYKGGLSIEFTPDILPQIGQLTLFPCTQEVSSQEKTAQPNCFENQQGGLFTQTLIKLLQAPQHSFDRFGPWLEALQQLEREVTLNAR